MYKADKIVNVLQDAKKRAETRLKELHSFELAKAAKLSVIKNKKRKSILNVYWNISDVLDTLLNFFRKKINAILYSQEKMYITKINRAETEAEKAKEYLNAFIE